VRFVAGGSELSNAVVEPSLLSLICRELNDARLAQGRSEISLDLLAGSHATILSNFYERALADQPPAVRRIIEDDLLTASGFRENVAEESLVSRFTEAGGAPNTLATLVNRRLLRIEERLDVRRVELTHDVLCSVVKASRDRRQEREAREATERLLAEQRARELAAHRAAVRARGIAGGCAVLAALAVVAAVYGYVSSERAQRAGREAQQTRALAEQARGHAENLLGYLSDDFGSELESFGRLDVLAEFSQRQIDYFHALPPVLRGPESIRNGVLALVHHATALRTLGNVPGASADATEAFRLLQQLRDGGDTSEATTIALARTELVEGRILETRKDPGTLAMFQRADDLLRPLAKAPKASAAVRRAYIEALVRTGFEQADANLNEEAVRTEREAQRIAADMGATNLSNLDMGAWYAEGAAWLVQALGSLGHNDEALRAGEDADAVAAKVLERRPGYRLALHAQEVIDSNLSGVAQNDLNPTEGARFAERGEQVSLTLLKLDPANVVSINNLGAAHGVASGALWQAGRLREAIAYSLKATQDFGQATPGGGTYFYNRETSMAFSAFMQDAVGDHSGADATQATSAPYLAKLRQRDPGASDLIALMQAIDRTIAANSAYERDDLAAARRGAAAAVAELDGQTPRGALAVQYQFGHYFALDLAARTAYRLGDFAAAEQAERGALSARKAPGIRSLSDQRDIVGVSTWLAMDEARQGKTADAAQTIVPMVALERGLAARNHGDAWVSQELAAALYAEALAEPAKRAALLHEAGALLDGLSPEVRATHGVRLWRTWVRQAAQKP
jgi:hypothetical protein